LGDNSNEDETWESFVASQGVPVIGGNSGDSPFLTNADFFTVGTQLPGVQFGQVQYAKDQGKNSFGTIYCAEYPICGESVTLANEAAKVLGVRTTAVSYSFTAPNLTAQCLKLKNGNIEAMFQGMFAAQMVTMIQNCQAQGYNPLVINDMSSSSAQLLSSPAANGMVLVSTGANFADSSLPAVQQFYKVMNSSDPSIVKSSNFGLGDQQVYAGGVLFQAAAKAVDLGSSATSADVLKGLYAIKNDTLGGLTPPLTFTRGQPTRVDCYFLIKVSGGKYVSLGNGQPTCPSASEQAAVATFGQ
jgi:branched-chain amino acid transport system substrate-binding protein